MRQTRTIVVAGAGIGGLTAALFLARDGYRVVIVERAAQLGGGGAGIQLSPNAGRVLERLGLGPALDAASARPEAIEIRHGKSGAPLATIRLGETVRRRFGTPYRVIHRADLQQILAREVAATGEIELQLGTELVEFAGHQNGVTAMTLSGSTHTEIRASVLVAADGVNSTVRGKIPGVQPIKPTGRSAWRGVIPAIDIPPHVSMERTGLWLGHHAHLVHYPMRNATELNVVAIVKDEGPAPLWNAPGDGEWLRSRFRRWSPFAQAIMARAKGWRIWPLVTVSPKGPWVAGSVALLGDAAHAMPPYLAQGGAMAIEDAVVLGQVLAGDPEDKAAALLRYQALRRPRVKSVWRQSWSAGDLYHLDPLTSPVRDFGMRVLSRLSLLGHYGWIYRWQAD